MSQAKRAPREDFHKKVRMTFSLPQWVAEHLYDVGNKSAFVTEAIRRKVMADVRKKKR